MESEAIIELDKANSFLRKEVDKRHEELWALHKKLGTKTYPPSEQYNDFIRCGELASEILGYVTEINENVDMMIEIDKRDRR